METIGTRTAGLRALAQGLSASELGELAGLNSPAHVGMIERGDRPNISATTAVALARVLGCTAEYLVEGVGDPPPQGAVIAAVTRARAIAAGATPDSDEHAAASATATQVDGTPHAHTEAA